MKCYYISMIFTNLFQTIDKKWQPIHLLLIRYQSLLKKLFWVIPFILLSLIPLAIYVRYNLQSYSLIYDVGSNMGVLAFLLYLATFLPGVLQRFKILPLMTASMILFRRQLGILMFYAAIVHLMLVSSIPKIYTYGTIDLSLFAQKEIFGLIGVIILFPLWLTSNDFSIKKLGKFWKILQRFTYFALIFIFLHVALQELSLALIGLVVMLTIGASWVSKWAKKGQLSV